MDPSGEKEEEMWQMYAERRRLFREKNPGPHKDDWLDDEQWYYEYEADWSGERIPVPVDIFRDPPKLKEYLDTFTPPLPYPLPVILSNPISPILKHIVYINLDRSTERRQQMEEMFSNYGLTAERFSAIQNDSFPLLGCAQSHLAVLKRAREQGYQQVLIMEDDFEPTVSPEEFRQRIWQVSENGYDVFQLVLGTFRGEVMVGSPFTKVLESQNGAGYIVHERFYDRLIQLLEKGCSNLELTWEIWLYSNDIIWKPIQPLVDWLCFTDPIARQRPCFSTINNQYVEYNEQERVESMDPYIPLSR